MRADPLGNKTRYWLRSFRSEAARVWNSLLGQIIPTVSKNGPCPGWSWMALDVNALFVVPNSRKCVFFCLLVFSLCPPQQTQIPIYLPMLSTLFLP